MRGLLIDCEGKTCDTNTDYVSVVIHGTARLLEDTSEKENVLRKIIQKYMPHLTEKEIPMNMLKGTAVIQIAIREMTGKYYY